MDGQQLAPRQTQYKYHYRLFADYLEILQMKLDRILEIEDYMTDQEDIIKFKYEHYLEHRFHSIHDRAPTSFVQNIVTASIQQASPPSPEYSPIRESFAQIIKNFSPSSDDSESKPETDLHNAKHGLPMILLTLIRTAAMKNNTTLVGRSMILNTPSIDVTGIRS